MFRLEKSMALNYEDVKSLNSINNYLRQNFMFNNIRNEIGSHNTQFDDKDILKVRLGDFKGYEVYISGGINWYDKECVYFHLSKDKKYYKIENYKDSNCDYIHIFMRYYKEVDNICEEDFDRWLEFSKWLTEEYNKFIK